MVERYHKVREIWMPTAQARYHGIDVDALCRHEAVTPQVPSDADLESMDEYEVRRKYPRFAGVCPDCGEQVIVYGSAAHYIAGDW